MFETKKHRIQNGRHGRKDIKAKNCWLLEEKNTPTDIQKNRCHRTRYCRGAADQSVVSIFNQ